MVWIYTTRCRLKNVTSIAVQGSNTLYAAVAYYATPPGRDCSLPAGVSMGFHWRNRRMYPKPWEGSMNRITDRWQPLKNVPNWVRCKSTYSIIKTPAVFFWYIWYQINTHGQTVIPNSFAQRGGVEEYVSTDRLVSALAPKPALFGLEHLGSGIKSR
jgi:hypothetical protein